MCSCSLWFLKTKREEANALSWETKKSMDLFDLDLNGKLFRYFFELQTFLCLEEYNDFLQQLEAQGLIEIREARSYKSREPTHNIAERK